MSHTDAACFTPVFQRDHSLDESELTCFPKPGTDEAHVRFATPHYDYHQLKTRLHQLSVPIVKTVGKWIFRSWTSMDVTTQEIEASRLSHVLSSHKVISDIPLVCLVDLLTGFHPAW